MLPDLQDALHERLSRPWLIWDALNVFEHRVPECDDETARVDSTGQAFEMSMPYREHLVDEVEYALSHELGDAAPFNQSLCGSVEVGPAELPMFEVGVGDPAIAHRHPRLVRTEESLRHLRSATVVDQEAGDQCGARHPQPARRCPVGPSSLVDVADRRIRGSRHRFLIGGFKCCSRLSLDFREQPERDVALHDVPEKIHDITPRQMKASNQQHHESAQPRAYLGRRRFGRADRLRDLTAASTLAREHLDLVHERSYLRQFELLNSFGLGQHVPSTKMLPTPVARRRSMLLGRGDGLGRQQRTLGTILALGLLLSPARVLRRFRPSFPSRGGIIAGRRDRTVERVQSEGGTKLLNDRLQLGNPSLLLGKQRPPFRFAHTIY